MTRRPAGRQPPPPPGPSPNAAADRVRRAGRWQPRSRPAPACRRCANAAQVVRARDLAARSSPHARGVALAEMQIVLAAFGWFVPTTWLQRQPQTRSRCQHRTPEPAPPPHDRHLHAADTAQQPARAYRPGITSLTGLASVGRGPARRRRNRIFMHRRPQGRTRGFAAPGVRAGSTILPMNDVAGVRRLRHGAVLPAISSGLRL
jgi:hypothetical protein